MTSKSNWSPIQLRRGDDVGMATLILSRSELQAVVDVKVVAGELRNGFAASREDDARRIGANLGAVSAMVLVPGLAPGVPAYTVKVHAKAPARRPALVGVICLHDLGTGDLLAILDSGWLTALRTGLGAALGTHVLARPDASAAGVVGAGAQGRAGLAALAELRPISSVVVFDTDPGTLDSFVHTMADTLGVEVTAAGGPAEVAGRSEMILMATWSRAPLLGAGEVRAGSQVTSWGADEPGKQELEPGLLAGALTVVDDRRLAAAVLGEVVDATLGEVLRGEHPGRRSDREITVYSPVGLPMQDCVIAWHAYRSALAAGVGTVLDLERAHDGGDLHWVVGFG